MPKSMTNSHPMGGEMGSRKDPYTVQMMEKRRYQLKSEEGMILKNLYNGILPKEYYAPMEATSRVNLLC